MSILRNKKLWIWLGAIAGVIITCVILCFTLFALKSVSVVFHSSVDKLVGQENEIVQSGEFSYGKPVLFLGKKKAVARLEKSNPYLKVVNIETVFPSSYVIHATERREVYAVLSSEGDKFYITDEEFKVLRIETEFASDETNPILFSGLKFDGKEPGEFLQIENAVDFFSAFVVNNRPLYMQQALVKSAEIKEEIDENINEKQRMLEFKLFDGQTYQIKDCSKNLPFKLAKMLSVHSDIFSIIGQPICELQLNDKGGIVYDEEGNPTYQDVTDAEGGQLYYTKEIICQSTIEIFSSYDPRAEIKYYFRLIPKID